MHACVHFSRISNKKLGCFRDPAIITFRPFFKGCLTTYNIDFCSYPKKTSRHFFFCNKKNSSHIAFTVRATDEDQMFEGPMASSVPNISFNSDERLLQLAEELINTSTGFYSPADPNIFAEDFVFRGEAVGPECKKDYLENMDYFKIHEAFPDIQSNAFGFAIDPLERKRVWFFCRNTGTHTGTLRFWPIEIPPTGKKLAGSPEAFSMLFDDQDKLKLLTVGYPVDRDYPGINTEGLGAVFGILKAVGVPFPTGRVYQTLAKAAPLVGSPRAISKEEDIPEWYQNYTPKRRGNEGTDY